MKQCSSVAAASSLEDSPKTHTHKNTHTHKTNTHTHAHTQQDCIVFYEESESGFQMAPKGAKIAKIGFAGGPPLTGQPHLVPNRGGNPPAREGGGPPGVPPPPGRVRGGTPGGTTRAA